MVEEDSPPAAIIQAIIPSLSVADGEVRVRLQTLQAITVVERAKIVVSLPQSLQDT